MHIMKTCIATGLLCIATCLFAEQRHVGQLIVTVTDTDHCPVTNATVTVRSPKDIHWGRGCDSEYNYTSATADTNGIARVVFDFYTGDFLWAVTAPSHHSYRAWDKENFNSTVVDSDYLYFETNTVDGLAKFNELKALEDAGDYVSFTNLMAKFEPKSITYTGTCIERSRCYYPKRNPQPMYFHIDTFRYFLPMKNFMTETNDSVEVLHYRTVDFDMKIGRFLPPWGGRNDSDPGEVSDFRIVRDAFTTNGVAVRSGRIEFAPGCGAYRGTMSNDDGHFQGFYAADTNAVFSTQIPFEQRMVNGKWKDVMPLLATNEYMVLRTRVTTNEVGVVTNCNYSTILGRMDSPWRKLTFDRMFFNPRPNDPNLEYNGNNLDE